MFKDILDAHERFAFYHTTRSERVIYWRISGFVVCLLNSTSIESQIATTNDLGLFIVIHNVTQSHESLLQNLEIAFDNVGLPLVTTHAG